MSDTTDTNVIEFPSQDQSIEEAMQRHPSAQPVAASANGNIIGGSLAIMNDTAILVVHVEIGDGQTVMAGLGAEAVNNLLAAVGQRNGLVSVTYDPATMSGLTFAPRPARV